MKEQTSWVTHSPVGGLFNYVKPTVDVVVTLDQISRLLDAADQQQSDAERSLRQGLGIGTSADLGPVTLIRDEIGVHAVNLAMWQDVDLVVGHANDTRTELPARLRPEQMFSLSAMADGPDVPGTSQVRFRTLNDGGIGVRDGLGCNLVASAGVRRLQMGRTHSAGHFKFRLTPTQIILDTPFSAAGVLVTLAHLSVAGAAGQEILFSFLYGEQASDGGAAGGATATRWEFDLPEHLGDYAIDPGTDIDLELQMQYTMPEGKKVWSDGPSNMSRPAGPDLLAGLRQLRGIRRQHLEDRIMR